METNQTPSNTIPADLNVDDLAGGLMDRMILELQQMREPWAKMSQAKQKAYQDRLRASVGTLVRETVSLVASREFDNVQAVVDQVVFKDGVKIVLKSVLKTEGAHKLADYEGSTVVVVVADPDEFMGSIGEDRTDPDQQELEA